MARATRKRQPAQVARDWEHLAVAVSAVEGQLGRALRRCGLGLSEYRALGLLGAAPKQEIRLLDLADELGLDRSSVSRLVTRLEATMLVRRESCGDDRRGVFVVLTEDGRQRYAEAEPVYLRTLEAGVAATDLTPLRDQAT